MPAPVIRPDEIHFYVKTDKQDFIDAVKTRGETLEPAEVGHRVTSLGHLGQIAIQVGGKLKWDPDKERFLGNEKANGMIDKPIHAPSAPSRGDGGSSPKEQPSAFSHQLSDS
jgi:hypothetical protein